MATTEKLIEDLLNKMEPALAAAFRATIQRMRADINLTLLAQLLGAGRIDEALSGVLSGFDSFADTANGAFINSGQATATFMAQQIGVTVSFDIVNQRAVDQMQSNKLRLIREFTQEQRDVLRNRMTEGIRDGVNPRQQAVTFRNSVGLTERQAAAVSNYRRMLEELDTEALNRKLRDARFDRTLLNAVRDGKALDQATIDRMVERYGERYVKYRSEVIGRTEALRSVHMGTQEAFQQAVQNGTLDPTDLVQEWHSAKDSRVRDSHRTMNGQKRPFGLPFTSGDGNALMFPGDPSAPAAETVQCRCSVSTRIKSL